MNRIFVIADTHFGHKLVIEFEATARPFATVEEHDAELVRRWNEAVKPKDTVWHLGDVLFGRDTFEILGRLNGVKKLVMGNHDRYPSRLYLEHFNQVVGAAEMRDCILTHVPVHPSQFGRYKANIHGHLHSTKLDDARYINVSAECIGLAPVPLDDLLHNVELRGAEPALSAERPLERRVGGTARDGDVFESCPECAGQGIANALYLHDGVVSCPVHREVTDSRRMAEYRQRGSQFLLGKVPTQTLPVSSSEGSA